MKEKSGEQMAKLLSNVSAWMVYRIIQVGKDLQDQDIHLGMAGHELGHIPSRAGGGSCKELELGGGTSCWEGELEQS